MDMCFEKAAGSLNSRIKPYLLSLPDEIKWSCQEIRLRSDSPLMITVGNENLFVSKTGYAASRSSEDIVICDRFDLAESFKNLCGFSVHSYQNEINNGFITIKGGHRAGICGTAVTENEKITNVKNISSINLRIAREFRLSLNPMYQLFQKHKENMVVVGPPSSGKTTILRDFARCLSEKGEIFKTAIVDERGELTAVSSGVPGFQLGCASDCLYSYPKAVGIQIALRTLSPDVILFDEIGTTDELEAVKEGFNSGVYIFTSLHAGGVNDFLKRDLAKAVLFNGTFEKFIFLKGRNKPCEIECIKTRGELLAQIHGNSGVGRLSGPAGTGCGDQTENQSKIIAPFNTAD